MNRIILTALALSLSVAAAGATTFGPSFGDEVIAAGLGGLPFSWSGDGTIRGRELLTPQQNTTLNAVIAAHVPSKPSMPQQISAMQAKVALSRAGLLSAVQAWVNTQSAETQLIWNTSTVFNRNSAIIMAGAAALNLTQAQLDTLFIAAAAISP